MNAVLVGGSGITGIGEHYQTQCAVRICKIEYHIAAPVSMLWREHH